MKIRTESIKGRTTSVLLFEADTVEDKSALAQLSQVYPVEHQIRPDRDADGYPRLSIEFTDNRA